MTLVKKDNVGWYVTVLDFDEEFLNSYSEPIGFEEIGSDGDEIVGYSVCITYLEQKYIGNSSANNDGYVVTVSYTHGKG